MSWCIVVAAESAALPEDSQPGGLMEALASTANSCALRLASSDDDEPDTEPEPQPESDSDTEHDQHSTTSAGKR